MVIRLDIRFAYRATGCNVYMQDYARRQRLSCRRVYFVTDEGLRRIEDDRVGDTIKGHLSARVQARVTSLATSDGGDGRPTVPRRMRLAGPAQGTKS